MTSFLFSLPFLYHQPIIDTPFVDHFINMHNHSLYDACTQPIILLSCFIFTLFILYLYISQLFIQCICPFIVLYSNPHPSFIYLSPIITAACYIRLFSQAYYHCLLYVYPSFISPMHHSLCISMDNSVHSSIL